MTGAAQSSRRRLVLLALVRFGLGLAIVAALLFLPAGTADYWQGWVYLATLMLPMLFALAWLLRRDPALLERRLKGREKEPVQGPLQALGTLCYVLVFVVAGLDRRFSWSAVAGPVALLADALVLLGYAGFLVVLRANSYASRIIEVAQGQQVITTGPYALVRHPMYVAILLMFGVTPVALGSWWALLPALPLVGVLVARIRNEEAVLLRELPGYLDYVRQTRYRLLPGIW